MAVANGTLREFADEHLTYEIKMFVEVGHAAFTHFAEYLPFGNRSDTRSRVLCNAMLESWCVHTRALIDFLWAGTIGHDDIRYRKGKDRIALDFVRSPADWRYFPPPWRDAYRIARDRIGKEIVHIGRRPLNVDIALKQWQVADISRTLLEATRLFDRRADEKRLGQRWIDEVRVPLLKKGFAFTTIVHPDDIPSPAVSTTG